MELPTFTITRITGYNGDSGYPLDDWEGVEFDRVRDGMYDFMHNGACIEDHAVEVTVHLAGRSRRLPRWITCASNVRW